MRTAIVKSLLSVIMIAVGCQLVAPVPAQAAERKTISVYVSDENLPKVTDEHLKMIDRLIVHFGRISADGRLKLDALPHLKQAATLQRIHAVNPRISLILSIGGGNDAARSEFDAMVRKASTRHAFVSSVKEALHTHQLDGVDIDWEFPKGSQQADLIALLRELRTATTTGGRKPSISMTGAPAKWYAEQNKFAEYEQYLDQIAIMTYDMRGFGSFKTHAGHHAGLYTAPDDPLDQSANSAVQHYQAHGAPTKKLMIGAAWYSRRFTSVPGANHGLHQPVGDTQKAGEYHTTYDRLEREYINKNGYTRYWDDASKAPYLYNAARREFISYDDAESMKYKAEYVQQHNLQGIIVWRYLSDPQSNDALLRQLDRTLHSGAATTTSIQPQSNQPQNTALPSKAIHISQAEQSQPSQPQHEAALAAAGDNVPPLYYGGAVPIVLGGVGGAVYVSRRRRVARR